MLCVMSILDQFFQLLVCCHILKRVPNLRLYSYLLIVPTYTYLPTVYALTGAQHCDKGGLSSQIQLLHFLIDCKNMADTS